MKLLGTRPLRHLIIVTSCNGSSSSMVSQPSSCKTGVMGSNFVLVSILPVKFCICCSLWMFSLIRSSRPYGRAIEQFAKY